MILGLTAVAAFAQDAIITGTDGPELITGTPAGESIYARGGNDTVDGGPGDDELDGGPGADVLNGGTGSDAVLYDGSTGVTVTLDGVANDGVAGEGDNVGADVEDIFGADGPDKLDGSSAANTIDGNAGDDRISGGSGNDAIFGGDGDDVIETIDRKVDRISCGAGSDILRRDRKDVLLDKSCEKITSTKLTGRPDLTLRPRARRLIVGSLAPSTSIAIACARRCHPPTRKIILRRKSAPGPTARFKLPGRISGATIEIGVKAKGADPNCVRYKIGKGFSSVRRIGGACTTVVKSLSS